MNTLKFNVSIAIMAVTALMISCTNGNNQASEKLSNEILPEDIVELREDQVKLAGIELGTVEQQSMKSTIRVNGIIAVAPQSFATVCMPMGGFVKNSTLLPGNSVSKGQILASIDNQEFVDIQRSYLEAKNNLTFAEADYHRHIDLYKNDVYSEQNVQQVSVEYKNLKALLKSLEQKLLLIGIDPGKLNEDNISSTVNLASPINGFLKSVNINIGKYVNPTDVLFEIVNYDQLFLILTLFEKDADKVIKGQQVDFFINNEAETHKACITETGKSVGTDKSFMVYAKVTGKCENLLQGMYVSAFISKSSTEVTVLPSEAVVSFDEKDYVFIYEKDKLEAGRLFTEYRMIEVTKGVSDTGFTEIELPAGINIKTVKVVTKGAYNLLSAKKNAGEMAC